MHTALVTGAGRGIGRAIATQLAATGTRVAVTARTLAQLDDLVREITAAGGLALAIADDLADRAAPERIVQQVEAAWGPIDILINNAGIGSSSDPKPIVEFNDDFWDLSFAINVTAPYLLTKRVLPGMIAAGWGRIVNIASINASTPSVHGVAYTASKHAVAGLTKATAKEVAAHGITANAVCPGVTATEMNDRRLDYDAARLGKSLEELEAAASPLGRRLMPDEIAPLAVFLASRAAAGINGQCINVCGGTLIA